MFSITKGIRGLLLPILVFVILVTGVSFIYTKGIEAFAYGTDTDAINATKTYNNTYVALYKGYGDTYYVVYGNTKSMAFIKSSSEYYIKGENLNNITFSSANSNIGTVFSGTSTTSSIGSFNILICIYSNYDIYNCNSSGISLGSVFHASDTNINTSYTYEYSSSIPNVEELKIQKHYLYKLGPVYIGLNKLKYDVSWKIPTDTTLGIEVQVMGTYNSYTRAYFDQTYNSPMYPDTNTYLLPTDGKYTFNINTLAKKLTEKAFSDIDVEMKNQDDYVTPNNVYYRYVKQDDIHHKVYYGNWTKLSITKLGATGIVDANTACVTETTSKDPNTGETIYTDTPVANTDVTHYDPNTGAEITEEESFNAVSDNMDDALNSGVNAIKNTADFAGEVPGMVTAVFSFLPVEVKTILGLGVSLLVALRIWGR